MGGSSARILSVACCIQRQAFSERHFGFVQQRQEALFLRDDVINQLLGGGYPKPSLAVRFLLSRL